MLNATRETRAPWRHTGRPKATHTSIAQLLPFITALSFIPFWIVKQASKQVSYLSINIVSTAFFCGAQRTPRIMSSRYAASQNIASTVCSTVLSKQQEYRNPIKSNSQLSEAAAPRLVQQGDFEDQLMAIVEYIDDESVLSANQVQDFLQQARTRLKKLAELNVQNNHDVDIFIDAVKQLKQVEEENFDPDRSSQEEEGDAGERFQTIYQQVKQLHPPPDFSQEPHYRKLCEALGENLGSGDDDIEMMTQSVTQINVTCPITTVLLEDPVRSKVCKHNYSRNAIEQMIRSSRGKCKCPIPGCMNENITLDQLEADVKMAQFVKREQRRLDYQKETLLSQAEAVDDSDGDE